MNFETHLDRYTDLLIRHGLNLQPGQPLHLTAESCQRDFAARVADAAYRAGAPHVDLVLDEPRLARSKVLHASPEALDYLPSYVPVKFGAIVDEQYAVLRLVGSEDPDLLSDLDPSRLDRLRVRRFQAMERFYEEGIGGSRVHWSVAGAATPGWGKKVFPDLDPDAACRRLWEEIFRLCRVDGEDYLDAWKAHNDALHLRARGLDGMKVAELHFEGPGTDLRVGLTDRARWLGGTSTSSRTVDFEPNLPTEEVFTTPDYRATRGKVRVTRPFLVSGQMVEGLRIEFEEGRVTRVEADRGAETFETYIASDEGARRLGEVALVGIDSPVYRSGLIFHEILYDENAACHIAVGRAYKDALEGGPTLSAEELDAAGCNISSAHTDMMISDDQVDVTAVLADGTRRSLLEKGAWNL